jgi:Tfp pilus assembly protein PilO
MKAFTPLIVIALCIGAYYVYIGPTYSDVQNLLAEKDQYTGVLQQAQNISTRRDAILADYNAISPDNIDRLKKIMPENFDPAIFAKYVSDSAAKYGMVIKEVNITKLDEEADQGEVVSSGPEQYKTMSVTFSIQGPYDKFVDFLKDLESGLYLVDVNSLSVTTDNQSPKNSSVFNYSLVVYTYSLY